MGLAPLVSTKDMVQPARAMGQGGIGEVKLAPKDRVCQLGVPAFKQLLEHLPLAALKARALRLVVMLGPCASAWS